jgi:uncharacterized membrane protein (UPF0127 family)
MRGCRSLPGKFGHAVLVSLILICGAEAEECMTATPGVESMESMDITIEVSPEESRTFAMLIADQNDERAAGFQHICPEVISRTLILFVFPRDYTASFHMRNVFAPLDIAFIDSFGGIVDIQTMDTYVLGARDHPLYSPPVPARAALEADVGFFERHGIKPGISRIRLPE